MNWYTFSSLEAFNTWHESIKVQLGYPLPSKDINGNIVGEPFTTDYTNPVVVSDTDVRAYIDEQYASNLTLSESPILPASEYIFA